MRRTAVALAALVLAPTAAAWTPLGTGVVNTVVPSMLETRAGTMLVSFDTPNADTISLSRNHGAPRVVVANDPIAGQTQLVQLPTGAIELYYPDLSGVGRIQSTDDGQTWSAPVETQSHRSSGVTGAAVAADGTPYFVQEGTGYVLVSRGLNGETAANVFTRCCGYAASLAIDTAGLLQVAFYSNADPDGTFLYERLNADLSVAATTALKPTAPHDDRVPLVADLSGHTFLAWPPGYPGATSLTVAPFAAGAPAGDGVTFGGTFSGGDPHAALAVDAQDRLWAVWSSNGAVHVARSCSHGAHFGAVVSSAVPGTIYQVSAAAVSAGTGSIDVIANTGSSLVEQALLPGLTARTSVTTTKVGKKKLIRHWVQALDDGIPVTTATFTVRGKAYHANAQGKARIPAGSGKAAAPGYTGASFTSK